MQERLDSATMALKVVQDWHAAVLANTYTITASALALREEITGWLAIVALLVGILSSAATFINQFLKIRATQRRAKAIAAASAPSGEDEQQGGGPNGDGASMA